MIRKPVIAAACLFAGLTALAQRLPNADIQRAAPQLLQQQYGAQVRAANERVSVLQFPYPFYLSRALGVEERKQLLLAPGSVHFDLFQERTVVAISGNYFASYSTQLLSPGQRARQTFQDVMLPLLKAVVPEFASDVPFQAYALEIAHHVRGSVMGVGSENSENVVLVIPRSVALRLVSAGNNDGRQSALLDSQAFVNGEPITLWLGEGEAPAPQLRTRPADLSPAMASAAAMPAPTAIAAPLHDPSKQNLDKLQNAYQEKLAKLAAELGSANHFVSYAPPAFVAFRHGAYLQLSLNTELAPGRGGSQYRLAALAFDQHVAHLVRSVLAYLPEQPDFDGIDFATTVGGGGEKAVAVEFVVPAAVLRCYENYDCTGQQLINSSFVLINGERVSLDLQSAEAESKH